MGISMSAKKITHMSLLAAVALILNIIESGLPGPIPIPGVRLGLANIITVVAVYRFKPYEAVILVTVRVVLGALFAGGMSAFFFSAGGAAFCLCGMLVFKHLFSGKDALKYIPLCSVLGAMMHNIGQIAVAMLIMRSMGVLAYLPVLIVSGSVAGLFTGLCARAVENRLNNH